MHITTPAAAASRDRRRLAGRVCWGLAPETSVGFTTGATTANMTCIAAARHEVLRRAGWDVEADGLQGAPPVTVVAGEEVHPSVLKALRLVGLGQKTGFASPSDEQGRMRLDALRRALAPTPKGR
jgi:glutamate/tyrosine decarboxylase-like PLP-dependent enzyme